MQKIRSLDFARGFTVLMIAPIHTVLLYSKLSVRETLIGKLLAFIAEGPGAQLFMMIMGIFFALSAQKSFFLICKRAFYLLVAGYFLNIVKFVIPNYFGWLPASLLHDLNIDAGSKDYLTLFSIGDILHFAALATLSLYAVSKMKYPGFTAIGLASIYTVLSPYFWDIHSRYAVADYLFLLFGGSPPEVFFPFFPWIVYPLVGLSIGVFIKRSKELKYPFWLCRDMGWVLIILGNLLSRILNQDTGTSFYRSDFNGTIIHVGIVLVWLSVWQWIEENVAHNYFFDVLVYMSRNITSIYIIQWIIIFWLLPVFGYQRLGTDASVCAIALTGFLTFTISFLFKKKLK